jgi:hypothetical protein
MLRDNVRTTKSGSWVRHFLNSSCGLNGEETAKAYQQPDRYASHHIRMLEGYRRQRLGDLCTIYVNSASNAVLNRRTYCLSNWTASIKTKPSVSALPISMTAWPATN